MISMTWSAGVNEIVAKYEHRGDLSELAVSGHMPVVTRLPEPSARRFTLTQLMVQQVGLGRLTARKIV